VHDAWMLLFLLGLPLVQSKALHFVSMNHARMTRSLVFCFIADCDCFGGDMAFFSCIVLGL